MSFTRFVLAAVALLVVAGIASWLARPDAGQQAAARPKAPPGLGAKALPLEASDWIGGSPVVIEEGLGKNVYIVDFWATWCGMCRPVMERLSHLQEEYGPRGLVVVGVTSEPPDLAAAFKEKAGDTMAYTVAVDEGRKIHDAYMTRFGVVGYPAAFVVNAKGRVVWFGHDFVALEEAVLELFPEETPQPAVALP